jgi:hypothetical protein
MLIVCCHTSSIVDHSFVFVCNMSGRWWSKNFERWLEDVGSMASAGNSIIDDKLKKDFFSSSSSISNVFSCSSYELSVNLKSIRHRGTIWASMTCFCGFSLGYCQISCSELKQLIPLEGINRLSCFQEIDSFSDSCFTLISDNANLSWNSIDFIIFTTKK